MLVGREPERRVLHALLSGARVGEGSALMLTGEAGIGKSALLADAAEAAVGMRVLSATGTESEREVPFGGLLQLLRPALVHLDRIPAPQASALASALALAPGTGTGADRFAVGAATLSLLSRYAEDQPLVVLVDDAHLLDRPSAQALAFAARRLAADPVAVLVAVRAGSADASSIAEAGLPVLSLEGLATEAAGQLVRGAGRHLGSGAVDRLCTATGGNPLALLELTQDDADLEGLPVGAPLHVPASLARTFARRADRLSPDARTALVVAAAGGTDLVTVAAACRALDVDVRDLDEAVDADLLRLDSAGVRFRHGLVRSAVWSEAPSATRRAVHQALAAALPEAQADRRAWHLGEAATDPDEATAAVLDDAAVRARDRGAHAIAAAGFERAAALSPDAAARARRLVEAAVGAWQAGRAGDATRLLDRVRVADLPPLQRARAAGLAGAVATRTGSVAAACDSLLAAGRDVADVDPDTAVLLTADAVSAGFVLGGTGALAQAAGTLEQLLPRVRTERARWVGGLAAGMAGVLTGQGGAGRIRAALAQVTPDGPLLHDPLLAGWLVEGALYLRESEVGREVVETVVDDLRRRSAVAALPELLFYVARDQATTDRWGVAEATYTEGVHLAREAGHRTDLTACLAGLAWLEARQGREQSCREHAAEALQHSASAGTALFEVWALTALGELELGLGRAAAARAHLEQVDEQLRRLGLRDVDVDPAPELVDALLRVGALTPARRHAERHAERARAKGQPWSMARAARAVAMAGDAGEADRWFGIALEHHQRTPDTFELARTRLAYGAWLRRARRRVEARDHLRAAVAAFDRLGATPWADQAVAELRATGERAQRRGSRAGNGLTPQELQVAGMLAGGRTTKEAAAALFLSPKTVEYHLRHVYLKLDIGSRSELAQRLGQGA